jgi:sigma-54 specific flagellar transcriptional regulator A
VPGGKPLSIPDEPLPSADAPDPREGHAQAAADMGLRPASGVLPDLPADGMDLNYAVAVMEKKYLLDALLMTRGNKKRAAEILKLKRTTLIEKIKRHGIQDEDSADGADTQGAGDDAP